MKDEDIKSGLIAVLIMPFLVPIMYILMLPLLMLRTWCVWLLYTWFIQPLGLPHLSYWGAFGVLLFWAIFENKNSAYDKDAKWSTSLGRAIALVLIALFTVHCAHWVYRKRVGINK